MVKGALHRRNGMEKGREIQKYVAYLGLNYLARLKGPGRGVAEKAPGELDSGQDGCE